MAPPEQDTKPRAALSLDLDDLWAYLRSYGDERWREHPSFLDVAVPRILECLAALGLRATVFVVGRDAESAAGAALVDALAAAGHEIGNHSYSHDPGFHRFDAARLDQDLGRSEAALAAWLPTTGRGFRAPSFGLSPALPVLLAEHGYAYDSSLLPAISGPAAAAWERLRYRRPAAGKDERGGTYGGAALARLPQAPFAWHAGDTTLTEIPVTVMPLLRLPVHWTYLHFIADRSVRLAESYLAAHLSLLRSRGPAPMLLLHATDFLGADDPVAPRFVPGMRRSAAAKLDFLTTTLARYQQHFTLGPVGAAPMPLPGETRSPMLLAR